MTRDRCERCPETSHGGGGGIRTHGGSHHTRFRGVLLWPLGHATAGQGTAAAFSAAPRKTPPTGRALGLAHAADDLRTMVEPPVAYHVPHATRPPRPWDPRRRRPGATLGPARAAPAHMVHGSSVTASVQPVSCQEPSEAPAARSAMTSAWAVGSCVSSRSLWPCPMTVPSALRTTAPTGTSAERRARRATSQRGVHRREVAAAGLHGLRRQARRSSNRSPQPAFSHTATSTSTGRVPSRPHRSSRSAAGVPRSSAIAGSPNGA